MLRISSVGNQGRGYLFCERDSNPRITSTSEIIEYQTLCQVKDISCNPRVLFADMDDCTEIIGGGGDVLMDKELMASHPVDQELSCNYFGYRSGQFTGSTGILIIGIIDCEINRLLLPFYTTI
ncbi:hypothetical protein [Methanosphaerula subterraneus]|uniref:hypothetical protein n=1 Tax=Methanosphaerula subterraneus TaxID=3350244 RepID=UPI003F8352A8